MHHCMHVIQWPYMTKEHPIATPPTINDLYSSISSIKLSWIDQTDRTCEKQPINQIQLC